MRKRWPNSASKAHHLVVSVALLLAVSTGGASPGHTFDLKEALSAAYTSNAELEAARARLRALDETVSQAHAGFRPKVDASANLGVTRSRTATDGPSVITGGGSTIVSSDSDLTTRSGAFGIGLDQPLFEGGRLINGLRRAEAQVRAGRAQLRDAEQTVLLAAATSYAEVYRARRVLKIQEAAVSTFRRQLAIAERRLAEADLTLTDVEQTRSRLADAQDDLADARADLTAAESLFERVVGFVPGKLSTPWLPQSHLPAQLAAALEAGEANNPLIEQALYTEQSDRHAVDIIRGELLPSVSLNAGYDFNKTSSQIGDSRTNALSIGLQVAIPLYDGGDTYSRVRQAKHTHIERLQTVKAVRNDVRELIKASWSRLRAAKSQIRTARQRIATLERVLNGVRQEEEIGQRTILDVLNAESDIFRAREDLEDAERDQVVAFYEILTGAGRLTMETLSLTEYAYDPVVHYEEVRRKPWGTAIVERSSETQTLAAGEHLTETAQAISAAKTWDASISYLGAPQSAAGWTARTVPGPAASARQIRPSKVRPSKVRPRKVQPRKVQAPARSPAPVQQPLVLLRPSLGK